MDTAGRIDQALAEIRQSIRTIRGILDDHRLTQQTRYDIHGILDRIQAEAVRLYAENGKVLYETRIDPRESR